jgi:hypothetical protein
LRIVRARESPNSDVCVFIKGDEMRHALPLFHSLTLAVSLLAAAPPGRSDREKWPPSDTARHKKAARVKSESESERDEKDEEERRMRSEKTRSVGETTLLLDSSTEYREAFDCAATTTAQRGRKKISISKTQRVRNRRAEVKPGTFSSF